MYSTAKDLEERIKQMNGTVKEYIKIYKQLNDYQFAIKIVSAELEETKENITKIKQQHENFKNMFEETSLRKELEILNASYDEICKKIKESEEMIKKMEEEQKLEYIEKVKHMEKMSVADTEQFERKKDQLLQTIELYHNQLRQKKKINNQEVQKQEIILNEIKSKHQAIIDEKTKELQTMTEKYNATLLEITNLKNQKMSNNDMTTSNTTEEEYKAKEVKLKELLQENDVLDEKLKCSEDKLVELKKQLDVNKTLKKRINLQSDKSKRTLESNNANAGFYENTSITENTSVVLNTLQHKELELVYSKKIFSVTHTSTSVPIYTARSKQFRPKTRKNALSSLPSRQTLNSYGGNTKDIL